MAGTHATAVWTLSHQSSATISRPCESLLGTHAGDSHFYGAYFFHVMVDNLQLYLYYFTFYECCVSYFVTPSESAC